MAVISDGPLGVAYADRTFYVVGSHGCSRHGGEYRPSSFLLARIPPRNGEAGAPELSWRVADLLAAADEVAPYLGKPLDAGSNGLNIEGLAVVGDRFWLGLRAPSLDGRAFLVGPAQEQDVPYAILLLDPADPTGASELGQLPRRKDGKAEALAVLAEGRDELRVLVGYDGAKNGAFEEYRLKLR